jgi:hypothetical protein
VKEKKVRRLDNEKHTTKKIVKVALSVRRKLRLNARANTQWLFEFSFSWPMELAVRTRARTMLRTVRDVCVQSVVIIWCALIRTPLKLDGVYDPTWAVSA